LLGEELFLTSILCSFKLFFNVLDHILGVINCVGQPLNIGSQSCVQALEFLVFLPLSLDNDLLASNMLVCLLDLFPELLNRRLQIFDDLLVG